MHKRFICPALGYIFSGIGSRQRSPRRGIRHHRPPSGPICRPTDGRSKTTKRPSQNIVDQRLPQKLRMSRQSTSQSHTKRSLSHCMNPSSYPTKNLGRSRLTSPRNPTPRNLRTAPSPHTLPSPTTASNPPTPRSTPQSTPRNLPTLQSLTSPSPRSPRPTTPPSRNPNWRRAYPRRSRPTSRARSPPTSPLPTRPARSRRCTAPVLRPHATRPPSLSTRSARSQTANRVLSPLTGRRPVPLPVPSTTPLPRHPTGRPRRCTSRRPCTPPSSPPTTPLLGRASAPPRNPLLLTYRQVEVSRIVAIIKCCVFS